MLVNIYTEQSFTHRVPPAKVCDKRNKQATVLRLELNQAFQETWRNQHLTYSRVSPASPQKKQTKKNRSLAMVAEMKITRLRIIHTKQGQRHVRAVRGGVPTQICTPCC